MNRIVLIGNGFDLAHGLKTRYEDFINWYWDYRVHGFFGNISNVSKDPLCTFEIKDPNECWNVFAFQLPRVLQRIPGKDVIQSIVGDKEQYNVRFHTFFDRIIKSVDTKGWVDIEDEYYNLLKKYAIEYPSDVNIKDLNKRFQYLQNLLIKYLGFIKEQEVSINESIKRKIYAPIKLDDISVASKSVLKENVDSWVEQDDIAVREKIRRYGLNEEQFNETITYFRDNYKIGKSFLLMFHVNICSQMR